jgi:Putative Ig domain
MECLALVRTDVPQRRAYAPAATPAGYGPSDLASAYRLPGTGSGQTVAIVDAFDDPNAESDLAVYRAQYSLPPCTTANGCFRKTDQNGGTDYPVPNVGWAEEISLDVDMVSAACPGCHILLVEAASNGFDDIGTAENEAVALGASYVSNSYGGLEDPSELAADRYYNHPGVAITVASGDAGYVTEWPAASPYVTAVGGTRLTQSVTERGWTETAWSTDPAEGAGSGCSNIEVAKPSWQDDTGCPNRTIADVAAVADPATGVAVYDSFQVGGWNVFGGTSVATPIIASVYALAGRPVPDSYPASYPYASSSGLNDVTSGATAQCDPSYLCTAQPGYDGPTGLGTPNGLSAFTLLLENPGEQDTTVGKSVSLQIHATDPSLGLSFGATGLPPGLSIDEHSGLIGGTPTAVGSYDVTVTGTPTSGAPPSSVRFPWVILPTGAGCTARQLLGNPGFETGTAAPWDADAGVISKTSARLPARTGSWDAWLGGHGSVHTDTLSQQFTVPSTCSHIELSYYLHIETAEPSTLRRYDTLHVDILDGSTTRTIATYSNLNSAAGYAQYTFPLTRYLGKTITLRFTATEDASLATNFILDDTAAVASP